MPAQKIYFPFYTTGEDGKKAYEWIVVTGVMSKGPGTTIPEGEVCVSSRSMASTPPARLQPKGNQ